MSDYDSGREEPPAVVQGGRRRGRRVTVAAGLAAVAFVAALASSPGHRMLAQMPSIRMPDSADAAPFDAGLGFAADWRSGPLDGMIETIVEDRADRAVRHLAIEIDATAEQQDKLRAIVRDAVKDLMPMREKIIAARATARDLLTQDTIDRAAIEKFRADLIATHDAASKRLVQAVVDAADVLTPEQRRKIADIVAAHRGRWGPWGHGPWGRWGGWRN